jgi:hypothetical protein
MNRFWGQYNALKQEQIMITQTLTKKTLEDIFIQVDADPLAGRGHLSKRELLIDRILAHVRACAVEKAPATPRPILNSEPVTVEERK